MTRVRRQDQFFSRTIHQTLLSLRFEQREADLVATCHMVQVQPVPLYYVCSSSPVMLYNFAALIHPVTVSFIHEDNLFTKEEMR